MALTYKGQRVVKITFHTGSRSGFRKVRVSAPVRAYMDRIAQTIANTANTALAALGERYEETDAYQASSSYTKGSMARYRVTVRTAKNAGVRGEAFHNVLTKAFLDTQRRTQ